MYISELNPHELVGASASKASSDPNRFHKIVSADQGYVRYLEILEFVESFESELD